MAYTFISALGAGSTNGLGFTTGSLDTSGANFLVASVSWYPGGPTPVITDSKSNTWTDLTVAGGSGNISNRISYTVAGSVGSGHTFSLSGASENYSSLVVAAFSGAAASPFNVENGQGPTTSATASAGTGITPGFDNELIIAGTGFDGAGTVNSINSSFNISGQEQAYSAGAHQSCGLAYLIQTTAGAVDPDWTLSASRQWAAAIASFKLAAAGGGAIPNKIYQTSFAVKRAAHY